MQITLSVGGILMMIVAATLLNLVKITRPRLQPTVAPAAGVPAEADARGTVDWRPLTAFRRAIREFGLRELGWAGGRSSVVDCRFADRQSHRVFRLADRLVRPKVDVIAPSPKPAAMAARNATASTPSAEYRFGT
jgi:hypothetical protein